MESIKQFWTDYSTYVEFLFISFVFGTAAFLVKIQENKIQKTLFNLFSQIVFSTCAGFICFKLCLFWNFNENFSLALVATACFSGRIFLEYMSDRINKFFDKKLELLEKDKENKKPEEVNQ